MLEILAAASLALGTPQAAPSERLVTCLAYLSRAPEYASQTSEQIAQNDAFFEAAKGRYCSDEVDPLWPIVHAKARNILGLPPKGTPSFEQQPLAEQEMRSLLGAAWSKVGDRRTKVRLPAKKLEQIMDDWLSDDTQRALSDQVEAPVLCSRVPIEENRQLKPAAIMAGMASPAFRNIGERCGYPSVQVNLTDALLKRFPDASPKSAERVVVSFMGQMTFWSLTSQ